MSYHDSFESPPSVPPPPSSASPYTVPSYAYGPGYVRGTNGMAIASLVVSIAGFLMCPLVICAVGAVLGHIARKQIAQTGEEGDGLALAGVIVGWIGFGVSLLFIAGYLLIVVVAVASASTY